MPNITFYDCTPAFADVFSGTHKRPETIDGDVMTNITGNPPTLLYKRITEQHGDMMVIAERGRVPLFFAAKVTELREHNPAAPILLAGGRWLIAPNEDATSAAVMDVTSTAERSLWIEAQAWRVVSRAGVDFAKQTKILPLAKQLRDLTGCSLDKGKQHIAKALRRMRGEYVAIAQRGGQREGAGRPKIEQEKSMIQIWRSIPDGEKYVVEVDASGIVTAAAGPLNHSEIAQARKDGVINPDVDLADYMNQHESKFALDETSGNE